MRRFASIALLTALAACSGGIGRQQLIPNDANAPLAHPSRKASVTVTSASDDGSGSLRQAVVKAAGGSTITFQLRKHAKIVLITPISIGKNLKISGPGATLLTISGGRKTQLFVVAARKKVTISGLTLTQGAARSGGAIYNAGLLTLNALRINANVAFNSGAAAARLNPDARFDPRPRRHRRATAHPRAPKIAPDALTAIAAGGAIYNSGQLTVSACTFSNNVSGSKTGPSAAVGGAIAQFSGAMSIANSTFTSNFSGGNGNGSWGMGGAIYATAGTMTLSSDTFTAGKAQGDAFAYGGAVYADQSFAVKQGVFTSNSAAGTAVGGNAYGGAIYAGNGYLQTDGSFSANSASGGSSSRYGYAFGGAVDVESTATINGVTFTNNSVIGGVGGSAEGGALYLGGGSSKWTSVSFTGNVATALGTSSYANGGAVSVFAPLTIVATSALTSNKALVGNSASLGGQGGAIAVEVGPFSFTGTASENAATTEGGAFWIDDTATITNALLSSNSVTGVQSANDGGGGLYVAAGGELTLSGSTLTANRTSGSIADTGGGAVFNEGGGTILNSTIYKNSSSVDGGGIENEAFGGLLIANATIYLNTAAAKGGSLKNLYSDGNVTVTNSILAGGIADGAAGDVSNDGVIESGDYNIIQSAVNGNSLSGTTTHNLSVAPALGALANNGGPTPTNADSSSSPGTAYVPFNNCLAVDAFVDQRGYLRDAIVNGYCDVGAYEDQTP